MVCVLWSLAAGSACSDRWSVRLPACPCRAQKLFENYDVQKMPWFMPWNSQLVEAERHHHRQVNNSSINNNDCTTTSNTITIFLVNRSNSNNCCGNNINNSNLNS